MMNESNNSRSTPITATELKSILASHKLWVETKGKQGQRANLENASLTYANLEGANLEGANLVGANLTDANLEGANLVGANLIGTILEKKVENHASVKAENNIRLEFEALAKKHGMKIESLTLSLI